MYRIIYLCLPGQEDALKELNFDDKKKATKKAIFIG